MGGGARQMCSPSELSGMGAEHVEHVTVGRMTDARSCIGWEMSRDIVVDGAWRSVELRMTLKRAW